VKCKLLSIGKTSYPYIQEGIEVYLPRITRYIPFTYVELPLPKNSTSLPREKLLAEESKIFLAQIDPSDRLYLFDEKGKAFTSREFAAMMEKQVLGASKNAVFAIGGAYGFHSSLYERANGLISLSKMTFSHQMVRLFAVEQIYRALSIMRNEPYHND
jgi:23S rRNA (pseudouridine1915-N3)-methyltransferase